MKLGSRQAIHMEKSLEAAWVDLKVGWGRASENHQGEANSVSQDDGVSDMMLACQLCGSLGGGLRKGIMASASTSVWEKAACQLLP